MILGRVIGEVWATRRDARLQGAKLLVVRPHGVYEPGSGPVSGGSHLIATDEVHAGVGDEVIVCLGAPARWSAGGNDTPVDAAVLGVVEVAIALLIAARPFSPRASAVGSALAIGMFLTTLSFVVTTPGVWEPSAGGFPALSAMPGQFLIKDLALLGISLWSLGESWKASERT